MNLDYLYDMAEGEDIQIYDSYIEDVDGAFINIKDINAIVLNYKTITTSAQEKCVFSEELGHYYMDSTYSPYCIDSEYINKQEYKAKKWSYCMLVPKSALISAIQSGKNDYISLAEHFGVTIEYIINAIDFYVEKYGYITKEKVLN